MNNIEDIVFDPELGIDADLEPLLVRDGVNLLSLQVIGHWRRGFTEEEIGEYFDTNPKEVESMVSLVQGLVPPERLALDQKNRDEILKIKSESIELNEKFKKSLAKSPEAHMQEGRNPASVLKQFRESIAAGEPSVISGLREESNIEIIEKLYENNLAEEDQLIAELRRADQKPSKKMKNDVRHEIVPAPLGQNMQTTSRLNRKPQKVHPDRRVTVRLDPDLHDRLHQFSQDLGIDLSTVVREAIARHLEGESGSNGGANAGMPNEALARTGGYLVWGSGLKEKLRESFLDVLAMSYVTSKRWPRTKWVKELHVALLPLYHCLEARDVGHD